MTISDAPYARPRLLIARTALARATAAATSADHTEVRTFKIADFDAAWKLADKAGISVDDDGNVTGMDEVVAATLKQHPYLSPKPTGDVADELVDSFPALQPSGHQTNGRTNLGGVVSKKALKTTFPALARRRS